MAGTLFSIASIFISQEKAFDAIIEMAGFTDGDISLLVVFLTLIVLLCVAKMLNRAVRESYFYNSYFEGDLDGIVSIRELSDVTDDSTKKVRRKVRILRRLFMKNFTIAHEKDGGQIVLDSKKVLCQCQNCGAEIEKSRIFTGSCPYCGNLDITVRVLSSDRFYTINYNGEKRQTAADFFGKKDIGKYIMHLIFCAIAVLFMLILFFMAMDYIGKINDPDIIWKGAAPFCRFRLCKSLWKSN